MKQSPRWKQNKASQVQMTNEQLRRIDDIQQTAIAKYMGEIGDLESALGMLTVGYQYGWKVLVLIHSKATIRKYEEILGINIREEFPEEGPSADRNNGLRLAKKLGNFWKMVSGDYPAKDKRKTE